LMPASDDADSSSGLDGRGAAGVVVGVGVSHRGPHDLRVAARLGCRGIPSPMGWASMVRSGHDQTGFKQFVDLAARSGGHADHKLASGRVRASRRCGLDEAANLAVAQAVVDERENLAGHCYPGLVGAAPFGDAPKPGRQGRSAVIAGHRLDQRPPHQTGALLICGTGRVKENWPPFGRDFRGVMPFPVRSAAWVWARTRRRPCAARRAVKAGPQARPWGKP
jgi:hypothetical protein